MTPKRLALLLLALTLASCSRPNPPAGPTALEPLVLPPTDAPAPLVDTSPSAATPAAPDASAIDRIRDEGLNRSQVMNTLSYLADVIGPRLTSSPNLRRANDWTKSKLTEWGLQNAHLEPWGPFGRGWSLKRFSAQIVEPQTIPLIAAPKAWTPGVGDRPIIADVVYLDAKTEADFARYKGKLKGAIVLSGAPRDVQPRYEPLATRINDTDLLKLANADTSTERLPPGLARSQTASERRALLPENLRVHQPDFPATTQSTTAPAAPGDLLKPSSPSSNLQPPSSSPSSRASSRPATTQSAPPNVVKFLLAEGAAALLTPSGQGDGGTFFVASAALPTTPTTRPATRSTTSVSAPTGPQPWHKDAPATVPQVTVAVEDYNRLVRMTRLGEKLRMQLDLQVQFHDQDLMNYNTIAEIPGTDLKDEIVMLGAHLDSWHSGTGATDNGAGSAAVLEAVRIIKATGLKPRRTIRVALWTGEEQGLFGSKAYVEKHFGKYEDATTRPTTRPTSRPATTTIAASGSASEQASVSSLILQPSSLPTTRPTTGPRSTFRPTSRPARRLIKGPEYDRLNVYFNLDNGAGKVRGIYLQGNESARPLFRQWLAPFKDLGAETITLSNTGGTDHLPFDSIGLPGFQFIQDPLEYWTRTHHSNQDTYDRVPPDDLKQCATILATFTYNAAMMDGKVPRKPTR